MLKITLKRRLEKRLDFFFLITCTMKSNKLFLKLAPVNIVKLPKTNADKCLFAYVLDYQTILYHIFYLQIF